MSQDIQETLHSSAADGDLHLLEVARRKALWALAHLIPGDPRADFIIQVLDDIERQEQSLPIYRHAMDADEVLNLVSSEPHPIGMAIVRDEDIPQPWRERYGCASRGSTRVAEGAYLHDWLKFLSKWQQEMTHLERHRAACDRKG
jgi:hypothetical protein